MYFQLLVSQEYINYDTTFVSKLFLTSEKLTINEDRKTRYPKALSKLHILAVSTPTAPISQSFVKHVTDRYSGRKSGLVFVDHMINRFKRYCQESEEGLWSNAESTNMMQTVVELFTNFKKIAQHNDTECSLLCNHALFYSRLHKSIRNSSKIFTTKNQGSFKRFQMTGNEFEYVSSPLYELSYLNVDHHVGTYEANEHSQSWNMTFQNILPNINSRCVQYPSQHIVKRSPYVFIKHSSNFIVAGSGPLHGKKDFAKCHDNIDSTFFIRMQAFYYAVEEMRAITGIDFSTLYLDTCYAKLLTLSTMSSIFQADKQIHLMESDGTEHVYPPNHIVVFIGDTSSDISMIIQSFLAQFGIQQISYGSTSTLLTDKDRNPSFLRTVPEDSAQAKVMIELAVKSNWTSVGLIYSDSAYGKTGAEAIELHAAEQGICIDFSHKIETAKKLAFKLKSKGAENTLPRPLILFAEQSELFSILKDIQTIDTSWGIRGNIFIASDAWNNNMEIIEGTGNLFQGTISISLAHNVYNWTDSSNINQFKKFIERQSPDTRKKDPYFIDFWQKTFNCRIEKNYPSSEPCIPPYNSLTEVFDDNKLEGGKAKHIMTAGLSTAYAIREAKYGEQFCSNTTDCAKLFTTDEGRATFVRLLKETKVPIKAGSHAKLYSPFLPSGEGQINYELYNLVQSGETPTVTYRKIYQVSDGVMKSLASPSYYKNGALQRSFCFPSDCSLAVCRDLKENSLQSKQRNNGDAAIPKLIIFCFLLVIVLLVLAGVTMYKAFHLKHKGEKASSHKGKSSLTMQVAFKCVKTFLTDS